MLLCDYVEKKRADAFSLEKMSREIGLTRTFLHQIMLGRVGCSWKVARQIEVYTKGKVTAVDIMEYRELKQKTLGQLAEGKSKETP